MNQIFFLNKKGSILVTSLFLLFLIGTISAATDTREVTDVFKINENIEYTQPCFNNGSFCSSAAICNFTIHNPDNSLLLDNNQSTNQGSFYNVTFDVLQIGVYEADVVCCDGGSGCGSETMFFEVTGSGLNISLGFYIFLFVVGAGFIVFGFKIEDPYITLLGSFAFYFLALYILFNGIVGVKDLTTTWGTGIIILGSAMYISTRSAIEMMF